MGYGKDVYFQTNQLPPGADKGTHVVFNITVQEKGPVATFLAPICPMPNGWMGMPQMGMPPQQNMMHMQQMAPMPMMAPNAKGGPILETGKPGKAAKKDAQYYGHVGKFNFEKGYGHIICEEMKKITGKDVFLMASKLDGKQVSEGDLVTFKVQQHAKGPQAESIIVMPPGSFVSADSEVPGNQFTGTIKTYSDAKGFGHITGPEVTEVFGKDVFIGRREFDSTPHVGDEVTFTVRLDASGQPVAKKVEADGGSYTKAPAGKRPVMRKGPY